MFSVGSLIVYSGTGVCRVESVGPPPFDPRCKTEYYTLTPLRGSGTIYVPVNSKVFMRPILSRQAAQELESFLRDYLSAAQAGEIQARFWPMLWEQGRFLIGLCILGVTALGVAGIPVLFLARGFLFSFSVAAFCRIFGPVGLASAFFLFGLPALLWAPVLFLAGAQCVNSAWVLLRRLRLESREPLPFTSAYWGRLGLCGAALMVCVMLEYLAAPVLLAAAAKLVL